MGERLCSRPLSTGFNSDGAHFQRSISDAELAKRFIQLEKCCFIVNCFSSQKMVKMKRQWQRKGRRGQDANANLANMATSRRHPESDAHTATITWTHQKCCQQRNFSPPSPQYYTHLSTALPHAFSSGADFPASEYPMSCN